MVSRLFQPSISGKHTARNARSPRRPPAQRDEPEARRSRSARSRARDHAAHGTLGLLGPGDAALARLDVLPSLDGIEPGIWEIGRLEADGVHVLNRLRTLLATHDKLQTSRVLHAASLPHPRTATSIAPRGIAPIEPPVVVKPRFGSWGRDVTLCRSQAELVACLEELSTRQWFRRQGVLVQELIPPLGHDLRLVVAAGQVVGAVRRHAAEGEWRTNVALGAERESTAPPRQRARSPLRPRLRSRATSSASTSCRPATAAGS